MNEKFMNIFTDKFSSKINEKNLFTEFFFIEKYFRNIFKF